MKKKEIVRDYKFSDAALIQRADALEISANRDLTELGAYGVDAAVVAALVAARDVFAEMHTDEELMGDLVIATENKNAKRADLLIMVKQIADRARIFYGAKSGKFRKFGVDGLSKNGDDKLVRVAKRVGRVATEYLVELTDEGLTAPMIADMLAANDELDDLIDLQIKAIYDRDYAVEERILAGNALYALMVNLAAKGKLCWESVSEAKYNDYVLMPSSESESGNTVEGNVAAGAVVNISATGVVAGTMLEISNTGDADLKFYFAEHPTDPGGPMEQVVISGANLSVLASDLGYNEASMFTRLNVHNESALEGSYVIEY